MVGLISVAWPCRQRGAQRLASPDGEEVDGVPKPNSNKSSELWGHGSGSEGEDHPSTNTRANNSKLRKEMRMAVV